MKFSLIIPVYNTAKFLPDCIESCLHQGDFKLNEDELSLIENYRKLDGKGKAKAEAYLQAMVDFSDEKNKGFPL